MKENRNQPLSPEHDKALKERQEIENVYSQIFPLFVDQLLIATNNDPELVELLVQGVENIAYQHARMATTIARINYELHKADPATYNSPHNSIPKRESLITASNAKNELEISVEMKHSAGSLTQLIKKRSKLVTEGKSPFQKKRPTDF